MNMYICDRCGYQSNRKSNYEAHLARKRLCIKIDIELSSRQCSHCSRVFSNSSNRKRHELKCNTKKDNSTKETEEMKKEMKKEIMKEMRKEMKTTAPFINNYNYNYVNINTQYISILSKDASDIYKKAFENNYGVDVIERGIEGEANFILNHCIIGSNKPLYLCTDKSRKKCFYFNEDGDRISDPGCGMLLRLTGEAGRDVRNRVYKTQVRILDKNLEKARYDYNNNEDDSKERGLLASIKRADDDRVKFKKAWDDISEMYLICNNKKLESIVGSGVPETLQAMKIIDDYDIQNAIEGVQPGEASRRAIQQGTFDTNETLVSRSSSPIFVSNYSSDEEVFTKESDEYVIYNPLWLPADHSFHKL
jgi:hypothetical protein